MIARKKNFFLTFEQSKDYLFLMFPFFFYFEPILLSQYLAKDNDLNNSEFALIMRMLAY